jgi:hypothetical protein
MPNAFHQSVQEFCERRPRMARDWRELSEAASREQDPKKLLELVEQLDKALEESENTLKEKKEKKEEPLTNRDSNLYPFPTVRTISTLSA